MNFQSIFDKYGFPGIAIGGLAWFIMYLMKEHKKERKEWQQSQERRDDESNKNAKETNGLLTELKTLIQTLRK